MTYDDALVVCVQLEDLGEELRAARLHHLLGVVGGPQAHCGDGHAALEAHRFHFLKTKKNIFPISMRALSSQMIHVSWQAYR